MEVAPHIRDWNVEACWSWRDWPDRDRVMPSTDPEDHGIDFVARRRDGAWIAIQVKSRKLGESGAGEQIAYGVLSTFIALSAGRSVWEERWLVVNGAVSPNKRARSVAARTGAQLKVVNVAQAVEEQRAAFASADTDTCPHCENRSSDISQSEAPTQTRTCMQREAVTQAVTRLRANEMTDEDNIPRGEARGRIILPCGTGKTRIALRIVEELTFPGELAVVLCPSIALVAQTRREFLQHANRPLRVMAVCSDKGVAADEERVVNSDDATMDRGLETTEGIRGCPVTTDPEQIADWIRQRRDSASADALSVIFGTYQSAQRISDGIRQADAADGFKVLICDEAHRTAGIRRRKRSTAKENRLSEFTLCHDRDAFPATYRVYQTATPRTYGNTPPARNAKFVVREMNDQSTFGVELFRRSYIDAVRNGWLSDYRIVAMAVSGKEATAIANELVREADAAAAREAEAAAERGENVTVSRRRATRLPSTGDYLKGMGFALAMGGAARSASAGRLQLSSCIGFLNTIARSEAMTRVLQSKAVRQWVAKQTGGGEDVGYRLEHLDASSPVAARDEAKRRLAGGTAAKPHGVLNVGIFGEGTDSPSLSAVAFLEPRKSPIDVVQAVGRAMRRAEGKEHGYIVVPVVIPPGVDAERHLAISDKHEGWRELGDVLQALRAHDTRIEDSLADLLILRLPSETSELDLVLRTVIAVGHPDLTDMEYVVATTSTREEAEDIARDAAASGQLPLGLGNTEPFDEASISEPSAEPSSLIVAFRRPGNGVEAREGTVARYARRSGETRGRINVRGTKRRAAQMANGRSGRPLPDPAEREKRKQKQEERKQMREAAYEGQIQRMLEGLTKQLDNSITMNLLEKSGLTANRVVRDLNLLEGAVSEAARYLHEEGGLAAALDSHFGLDNLAAPKPGRPRADGATIAALLWMNAAMLHQRVYAGGWLAREGMDSLADIKAAPEPQEGFTDSWNAITRQDFLPVIEPALLALRTARRTNRLGGLRRALRHIAAEAEQIAEVYADMGVDHAGALFNKVMGDQSSDGAFFTRPVAATITARLAFDAVDPDNRLDWSDPDVWRDHKTVDLACGSGTLLTAAMTEMKRRATLHGADQNRLGALQKVAVEEVLKGLDINPVSLQLAATQLMSGNTDVKYRRMDLIEMPYGPQPDGSVAAGTLELFGHRTIVNAGRLFYDAAASTRIRTGAERDGALEGPRMDDAVSAADAASIIIMNPPFTNRNKMGQKFPKHVQKALRRRLDTLEGFLADADGSLSEFLDKNSLRPRFAALADLCLSRDAGVFATVLPTIALTNASGLPERLELAKRFHIHTILTYMGVTDVNFSQATHREMNESIVVMRRHSGPTTPDTRIISIDRFPADDTGVAELFATVETARTGGVLADGWGEVSWWPARRIQSGDWSAAVWRSPNLADAAAEFAERHDLAAINTHEREREREIWAVHKTEPTLGAGYLRAEHAAGEDI